MKRLLVLASLGLCISASAQQRPHYTQYILNNYIINPAFAGIENYTDIKISHRHQWVGLDGAPVTTYATIHAPLTRSDNARENPTTMPTPGENPKGRAFFENYEPQPAHHGIGATIINDRTGPLNRFGISGTYAYHMGLTATTNISAGVSVGMQNMTLNAGKLNFNTANDPVIGTSTAYLNKWRPDISLGVMLYSSKYFLGLAAQNVVPQKIAYNQKADSLTEGRLVPHLFLQAGYRFWLNDDVSLTPSALLKYVSPTPAQFELNAKVQFRDLIWTGASYRFKDGFAAMLGLNVSSAFNVGYSFDYSTTRLNTVSRGTHEILIGFLLGNRYGDWCPRNPM